MFQDIISHLSLSDYLLLYLVWSLIFYLGLLQWERVEQGDLESVNIKTLLILTLVWPATLIACVILAWLGEDRSLFVWLTKERKLWEKKNV